MGCLGTWAPPGGPGLPSRGPGLHMAPIVMSLGGRGGPGARGELWPGAASTRGGTGSRPAGRAVKPWGAGRCKGAGGRWKGAGARCITDVEEKVVATRSSTKPNQTQQEKQQEKHTACLEMHIPTISEMR